MFDTLKTESQMEIRLATLWIFLMFQSKMKIFILSVCKDYREIISVFHVCSCLSAKLPNYSWCAQIYFAYCFMEG